MDHRHGIDGRWEVWKDFNLRTAGFPVSLLEVLGDPETAARVDQHLARSAKWQSTWDGLRADIRARATSRADDWKQWSWLQKRLKPHRVPEAPWIPGELRDRLQAAVEGKRALEAERQQMEQELARIAGAARSRLDPVLRMPKFREALAWQNPRMLIELEQLEAGRRRGIVQTRLMRTLGRYVARYAGKNDHIGFFGPSAWGRIEGVGLDVRPGPDLIAGRRVHFEYWAIDGLARLLENDPQLRPWLVPRIHARVEISTGMVRVPTKKARPLADLERRILDLCDGHTPACVIARRLAWSDPERPISPEDVTSVLETLVTGGILALTASPPSGPWPERDLRETLMRVPDRQARERLIAPLDEMEVRRRELASAAGDPAAVLAAQGRLAESFHRSTGAPTVRNQGITYGGRGLVYEECSRSLEISLGEDVLARMIPALSLILTSSRWFVAEVGLRFRRSLETLHGDLRTRKGSTVNLNELLFADGAAEKLYKRAIAGAQHALQKSWVPILGPGEGAADVVRLSSAELKARVEAAFPRRVTPWPQARFHSPDVMIAAASPEEVAAGRALFVLGELHPGANLMMQPAIRHCHPDPEVLDAQLDADLLRPTIAYALPRDRRAHRAGPGAMSPSSVQLEISETPARSPGIRLASLMVEPVEGGGLRVVDGNGTLRFDVSEFFHASMGPRVIHHFKMLPGACTPRIVIDDLVIQRRAWEIPAAALAGITRGTSVTRFVALRELVRMHGLPRRVFVKSPLELKPVYHDLEGPLSLDSLSHLARRLAGEEPGGSLRFVEMLPTPEQCWLLDAAGRRYVSELRFAFLTKDEWKPSWERKRSQSPGRDAGRDAPRAAEAAPPSRRPRPPARDLPLATLPAGARPLASLLPDARRDVSRQISSTEGILWPALRPGPLTRVSSLLYQLERTQWMTHDAILESQRRQLQRLLRFCWARVPFYRPRLEEAGFHPQRPLAWETFHALPPLKRVQLLENFETIKARSLPPGHGKAGMKESSGSTGQVVRVLYTEPVRVMWNALTLRDHAWHQRDLSGTLVGIRALHGVKEVDPRGSRGRSWGAPTDRFFRTGPGHMFDCRLDPRLLLEKLTQIRPRYILTFPSVIEGIARAALEKGVTLPGVQHVVTISEMLRPEIRTITRKALDLSIIDIYSSVELGYMALQCPVSENYHVQSESMIIEVVDEEGRPCPPGVMGRVLVTSLMNFATPMIRYEILDYAELGEPCDCGRGLPVIRNLHGRSRNLIRMPDGSRQRPSLWSDEWSEIAPIRQVQVIQKELDRFEVHYVMDRPLQGDEEPRMEKSLTRALGGHALRFSFHHRTELIRAENGKFELIKSEIKD